MRMTANRGLAIIVGALLVAVLIVANLASSRTAAPRDPNSPEGVVQAYLSAVLDRRGDDAVALLDPASGCTAADLDAAYYPQSVRADLVSSETEGTSATVRVRIEHTSSDPFGGSWTEDQMFRLTRSEGAWRIEGPIWPGYACAKPVK